MPLLFIIVFIYNKLLLAINIILSLGLADWVGLRGGTQQYKWQLLWSLGEKWAGLVLVYVSKLVKLMFRCCISLSSSSFFFPQGGSDFSCYNLVPNQLL